MKLAHIDTKDMKFEPVSDTEKAIIQNPYHTKNSFGRESAGYVYGFDISGSGSFDLRNKPDTPKHEGAGRYCHDCQHELNYDASTAQNLVQAMQTEGEAPLKNAENLRAFCKKNAKAFQTAENTYVFKIVDNDPQKRGYFPKREDGSRYEGGVSFFTVKFKEDIPEVSVHMDTFITDLLYPYIDAAEKGVPLYDRGETVKCRIGNGSEIQISGKDEVKVYSCYLYDTRTLYEIDSGIQPDKLVRFEKSLEEFNKDTEAFLYSGEPYGCKKFPPDIDSQGKKIEIRKSSIIPKEQLNKMPVILHVPIDIVKVRVGKNSGKEFLSIQVPNDDPNDKRYNRTFPAFQYNYCSDGKHVNINLDPNKKVKLTRYEKVSNNDSKQEESWCTVGELKKIFEGKSNLQEQVHRNAEAAKRTPRREAAAAGKAEWNIN